MNQTTTIDFGAALDLAVAAGLFDSLCTIMDPVPALDARGSEVDDSPLADDLVHEDLPCMIGIPTTIFDLRVGEERRSEILTTEQLNRQINLDGYYSDITVKMYALVDGTRYNIVSVLHDSQFSRTSLLVELVGA